MPRQLPWANKGGSSRTQVKQPQAAPKRHVPSDIDDYFFEDTVLGSSEKRNGRADALESDDELPELPTKSAGTTRKKGDSRSGARMPSSSPPPVAAELPPPTTEYMHKSVDKFDLCDDEWMMVEDELLQTAKLFTQHLHLKEYERLKTKMELQRKEAASRPVVPNAKPSTEGQFKQKAKAQVRNQRKTIKDLFSSAREAVSDEEEDPSVRDALSKTTASIMTARPSRTYKKSSNNSASDSDDLDAPKRPTTTFSTGTYKSSAHETTAKAKEPKSFAKPAIPSTTRAKPTRVRRPTPFDMWDDLAPSTRPSIPEPSSWKTPQRAPSPAKSTAMSTSQRSSSPTKCSNAPIPTRQTHPLPTSSKRSETKHDTDDMNVPRRDPLAKQASDRLAKRKTDKEREEKKKLAKFDDIPTFLF